MRTTGARHTKRSIVLKGKKTSVSLEDQFWECAKEIAMAQGMMLTDLVNEIDRLRVDPNLSSAIRVYVLAYYQNSAP